MSIAIYESWDGGEYTGTLTKGSSGGTVVYVEGVNSLDDAAAALFAWLPATRVDQHSESGYLLLEKYGPIKRIAEYAWECPVSYVDPEGSGDKRDPPKKVEFKIDFDLASTTTKVTLSGQGNFTAYVDPAYANPNPEGAINAEKHDGKVKVQGIDVRVPGMKLTISYRLSRGTITSAYARTLREKMMTRNSSTFLGWRPKELLFVGGRASQAVFGEPELQLEFETDIEIRQRFGNIPLVTKPPHDYLDLWFDTEADDAAGKIISKPVAAYVHNFYGTSNFASLFGFGP